MLTKEDYIQAEQRFYEALQFSIGQEIYLYCVTGSFGCGKEILGWSDIDVLIVLEKYNKLTFDIVGRALVKASSETKIGVTVYSLEEFNHRYFKDSKTYISIKFIKNGCYKPRIVSPEIRLVDEDEILSKYMDIYDFSKSSCDMKKELLKGSDYDEKKVYKLTVLLLRIVLNQLGVAASDYSSILTNATRYLPNFNLDICHPKQIMANPNDKIRRHGIYLEFLEWLRKNIEIIFK